MNHLVILAAIIIAGVMAAVCMVFCMLAGPPVVFLVMVCRNPVSTGHWIDDDIELADHRVGKTHHFVLVRSEPYGNLHEYKIELWLILMYTTMGAHHSSDKRAAVEMDAKGKEPAIPPANFIGYMQLIPDDRMQTDIKFIRNVQGKLRTVFPHGGHSGLEETLATITFGKNAEFIAAEQAGIRKRCTEKHAAAILRVAADYHDVYVACCTYMDKQPIGRQTTDEVALAAVRDALLGAANEWFYESKAGHEFVDDNGIQYKPYTFQFAKKLHHGEDTVQEDIRVAILRMIVMFIIETYEQAASVQQN